MRERQKDQKRHNIQTPALALTIPEASESCRSWVMGLSFPVCELRESLMGISWDVPLWIGGWGWGGILN